MPKTTIQISENLRKRLKVVASHRDITYNEALQDLLEVFEDSIPFRYEREFAKWFEENLDKFGFSKILERRMNSSPDYRLMTDKGEVKEVELELLGRDFERHGHETENVDLIVCVYSSKKKIKGVSVLSLINLEEMKQIVVGKRRTTIKIPLKLYQRLKNTIKDTGFSSVTEFIVYVMRTIVAGGELGEETLTNKKIKAVRKRLRRLGYLK